MGARLRRDHRQRRPDERRRLPPRSRTAPRRLHACRCSSKGASVDRPVADRHAGRSIVVENNYGYSEPDRDREGRARPRPGSSASTSTATARAADAVWRTRRDRAHRSCRSSRSPTGSSTRTRSRARDDGQDAWYLTALDFRTGKTRLQAPAPARASASTTTTRRSRSAPTARPTSGVLGGLVVVAGRSGAARLVRQRRHRGCDAARSLPASRAGAVDRHGRRLARVTFTRNRARGEARPRRPFTSSSAVPSASVLTRRARTDTSCASRGAAACEQRRMVPDLRPGSTRILRQEWCISGFRRSPLGIEAVPMSEPAFPTSSSATSIRNPGEPHLRRQVGGLAARGAREAAPRAPRAARDPGRRHRRPLDARRR